MKILFYNNYPDFFSQLEKEVGNYSHLNLVEACPTAHPLTLPDYDFLLLTPWQQVNEIAAETADLKRLETYLTNLKEFIELTQVRNAQLIVLLPLEENLISQQEKELYAEVVASVTKCAKHLILASNPSLNFNLAANLVQLVKQPTASHQEANYSGVQTLNELARVTLAVIAQLATGAKNWGHYSYQTNNSVSLVEIIRLLKPVENTTHEIKQTSTSLTLHNNQLLENFGIHPRNWLDKLTYYREQINA